MFKKKTVQMSWTPVSDGINHWLQIGSKMSRKSATEIN